MTIINRNIVNLFFQNLYGILSCAYLKKKRIQFYFVLYVLKWFVNDSDVGEKYFGSMGPKEVELFQNMNQEKTGSSWFLIFIFWFINSYGKQEIQCSNWAQTT